ncbi:uncharacterized protein [Spinacia oleracea]|uniref:CCHC-type domain-containing protein n=1 Tax=Spinacia oleracea TaxID=3562 RepID=A0A9R0IRY5_SPIOL|nr:uncharacterized protein LOC110793843 [Spinacia oleracea]
MKSYLQAMSLWDVVESDNSPSPLSHNPTLAQLKKYDEEIARKPRALSILHGAVSEEIFTTIMGCGSPKVAWEKIKEEFEGNHQTKLMQILNLKREFEMMGMKSSEGVKEYGSRLMSVVNQIKLLGGEFTSQRVVDKILVTLPEKYEGKISSLEDTKDLSTLTFSELINSLHAVDQRRIMRNEDGENKGEKAFLAKSHNQKWKGKPLQCNHCQKGGHEEKNCWHKGKPKCFKCQKFGHLARNCRLQNVEEASMAQVVVEENLF